MNRPTLLAITLCAIAACADAPTSTRTLDAPASVAATVETIMKGRFPIGPRTVTNECTGEKVDIVGEFNLVVRQVTTPNGAVHFMIHSVAGHVTGVGQTTGTTYVSNEHTNYTEHWDGPNYVLAFEFGITTNTKGGEANNVPGKLQIFLVIDANGEVRVDRFVSVFECRS
jgi:hypothetical protein